MPAAGFTYVPSESAIRLFACGKFNQSYQEGVIEIYINKAIHAQYFKLFEYRYGFLATFGDLGWGKAEGRGQKEEERKISTIKALLGL